MAFAVHAVFFVFPASLQCTNRPIIVGAIDSCVSFGPRCCRLGVVRRSDGKKEGKEKRKTT